MADNVALVRGLYEAWNDRNFDLEADAMAPDATVMMVGTGDVFEGPDGSRRYNEGWVRGFPDGKITVDKTVAEGDSVVVEYTGRGTHTGTLDTSTGAIPATGRSVTLKLCDVLELSHTICPFGKPASLGVTQMHLMVDAYVRRSGVHD